MEIHNLGDPTFDAIIDRELYENINDKDNTIE
jgi:hypothetical protein